MLLGFPSTVNVNLHLLQLNRTSFCYQMLTLTDLLTTQIAPRQEGFLVPSMLVALLHG